MKKIDLFCEKIVSKDNRTFTKCYVVIDNKKVELVPKYNEVKSLYYYLINEKVLKD